MWIIASLLFIGIIFLLVESLLTPGFGLPGLVGLASLAGACVYAFPRMGTHAGIIVTVVAIFLVLGLLFFILRSKTWKKLELGTELKDTVENDSGKLSVGMKGSTLTRLAPMGTARFGSLSCEVRSHDNNMVSPGTEIEVVDIQDNKVIVKPIEK